MGALRNDRYRLDGAVYTMAKHGFARRSMFSVTEAGSASAVFSLGASDETRAVYPFAFRLDIRFTVEGAALAVEAVVSNLGDSPMPASFGFHPALRWPLPFGQPRAGHRLTFERDELAPIRRIDAQGLLTPEPQPTPVADRKLPLRDDLFVEDALIFDRLASRAVSYGAETGPSMEVEFEGLPLLGVWTKPGAGFICIEPWAGIADPEGFDGDLREKPHVFEVEGGGVRRFRMTLRLNAAPERPD